MFMLLFWARQLGGGKQSLYWALKGGEGLRVHYKMQHCNSSLFGSMLMYMTLCSKEGVMSKSLGGTWGEYHQARHPHHHADEIPHPPFSLKLLLAKLGINGDSPGVSCLVVGRIWTLVRPTSQMPSDLCHNFVL
ncbi:hypothetical protein EDC04DRAFT_2598453 [Pisolithus marmoratus]|nr:hypothetical protein EDC04DRAFT_2598453 [Pisolithus marmoratus]